MTGVQQPARVDERAPPWLAELALESLRRQRVASPACPAWSVRARRSRNFLTHDASTVTYCADHSDGHAKGAARRGRGEHSPRPLRLGAALASALESARPVPCAPHDTRESCFAISFGLTEPRRTGGRNSPLALCATSADANPGRGCDGDSLDHLVDFRG